MVVRIVKMQFKPEHLQDFLTHFDSYKVNVRSWPGCERVDLLQDKDHSDVIFTYSRWKSEDALSAYRNSGVFRPTWEKLKPYFAAAPQAWSLHELDPHPQPHNNESD